MYYSQQSPGPGAHKFSTHAHHDQNPWSRAHFGGPPPPPQSQQPNVVPGPTSPAFPIYTNGAISHIPHHPASFGAAAAHATHTAPGTGQHHHQNSLSYLPSPPNGHAHAHMPLGQPSPTTAGPIITQHWQTQLLKCDTIRASRSPHHRARASAMASRSTKAPVTITNPNAAIPIRMPPELNGTRDDKPPTPTPSIASTNEDTSPKTPNALTDHPSSTAAPVSNSVTEAPRPTAAKPVNKNTWHSLDMGGINIKNIPSSSGLFAFTFLTNLYLNHNQLSHIPPDISRLRQLELLDLSGNHISTVPVEMGMLTQLKELYLFDNQLTTLPMELGTLHQLQTMGIEGNPIDESLKKIVQTEGTTALVAYLRDNCPPPPTPPPRPWHTLISQAELDAQASDPNGETFRIQCFNVLCEKAGTARMYGYTPAWALPWSFRKELILEDIRLRDADLVCLQEVDIAQYEEYFVPQLAENGYQGVYYPKSRYKTMSGPEQRLVDGCATFFKPDKFKLVEEHLIEFAQVAMHHPKVIKTEDMFNRLFNKDQIAVVCLFELRDSGTRLIVANTHLHWDPAFRDVKLIQTALLVEETQRIADAFARYPPAPGAQSAPTYADGSRIPLVACTDLNSIPESGVYELLSTGAVPPDHEDFMGHIYGQIVDEGLRHRLGLKSAYDALPELPVTNYTSNFRGTLDYIWYSAQNLTLNGVLGGIDKAYLEKVVGFPNAHYPSDHISIASEFRIKPPRESQTNRPPPSFPP